MNYEIISILTSGMLFSYWLNYIMGYPLAKDNDVDPKAILFSIPLWLATRKIKYSDSYKRLRGRFFDEINITSDTITKVGIRFDHKRDKVLLGRQLFTWERAIFCPVCFHFWLSLFIGIILISFDLVNARADFFLAVFTYLVNHLIIRKIS